MEIVLLDVNLKLTSDVYDVGEVKKECLKNAQQEEIATTWPGKVS